MWLYISEEEAEVEVEAWCALKVSRYSSASGAAGGGGGAGSEGGRGSLSEPVCAAEENPGTQVQVQA